MKNEDWLRIILAIFWYFLLLFINHFQFSSGQATEVALSNVNMQSHNIPLRKMAHVFFYGVEAILLYRVLILKNKPKLAIAISLILIALMGFIDEFIQYFSPVRYANFSDILIDIGGGAMALILYYFMVKIFENKNKSLSLHSQNKPRWRNW